FAGYEVQHVWGTGSHSGKHGAALFPDAIRWLWRDWPQPVKAGVSANNTLRDILIPGEGWRLVGEGYNNAGALAVSKTGEVVFSELAAHRIYRIDKDGRVSTLDVSDMATLLKAPTSARQIGTGRGFGMAFGPSPGLYALGYDGVVAYDLNKKSHEIAAG